MKILIIEDDPRRHRYFRRGLIGASIDFARSAQAALRNITEVEYDVIFFDHDLFEHSGPDAGTGMDVAKVVSDRAKVPPKMVMVHSLNPSASADMVKILRGQGITTYQCPFVWEMPEALQMLVRDGGWPLPDSTPS